MIHNTAVSNTNKNNKDGEIVSKLKFTIKKRGLLLLYIFYIMFYSL